ncbi:YcgN family cysteine cluster protein [Bartonella sp. DGB1]|uniref:YcgN family cysteine cluster protein n=1 Tax=Bartonella sp. DGB1 TaxID=3239807 RepID=UPI0035266CB7
MSYNKNFWSGKKLDEFSSEEWEKLCDRCGLCCLHSVEDEDTGKFYLTGVACKLLDKHHCKCSSYSDRKNYVPDCVTLTPEVVEQAKWLPKTCAYVLIKEGKNLYDWHHLISGSYDTIHQCVNSARDYIDISDDCLENEEDIVDYIKIDIHPKNN